MPKLVPSAPAERVAFYERLVATQPDIERRGATLPYTALNGNMSSYLDASGTLALRLSATDRAAFMDRFGARLQEAYGIVQQEYVAVPAGLLARTDELRPWFEASVNYVAGLKAKPTKRAG